MPTNLTAKQIMRRELVTLKPDTPAMDGIYRLIQENISGAPVVGADGQYLGIFSEKCSFQALANLVEGVAESHQHIPQVHEFMNRNVITLRPETPVFDAIEYLLQKRISGAPVVDSENRYLGTFSEKTAMQVIINAVYEGVPGSNVQRYMNIDRNRLIDRNASLRDASQIFLQTPYRRLPVLNNEKLEGQVSRRDVLRTEYEVTSAAVEKVVASHREQNLLSPFQSGSIGQFMDLHAITRCPDSDLLTLAETFLNSPYRRLPILEGQRLIGQISRRDLLAEALKLIAPDSGKKGAKPLYLSSVTDEVPRSLQ